MGSDRISADGQRVVVESRVDMPGWEVRAFRRAAIHYRGSRYFVSAKSREGGTFRYTLERWQDSREDIDGGVIEYDEGYVAERDALRAARAAASGVRRVLVPLYPVIGLLPGAVKKRLADGYGISEDLATTLSLWLEFMVAAALGAVFTIRSMTGVYGAALGVRDRIPWLGDLAGLAMVALALIVPDLVMRYTKILGESRHPWGFWEWLFRRER